MNLFCWFFLIIIKNSKFGCFISIYLSIMGCKRNNLIYYYCHKILFKLENEFFKMNLFCLFFLIIIKNSKFGCFISNYLSIMRCNRNNLIYYYCHKILFKLENEFFKLLHFLLVFLDYY